MRIWTGVIIFALTFKVIFITLLLKNKLKGWQYTHKFWYNDEGENVFENAKEKDGVDNAE